MRTIDLRRTLLVADGLAAVTAVGGGLALLAGLDEFPRSWLRRTPFDGYRIPALLLSGVVGGSASLATLATLRSSAAAGQVSMIAGATLVTWIVAEMRLLDYEEDPADARWIEPAYLLLGAAMTAMGAALAWRR